MELYNYKAAVQKIVDGDTANLVIDLGFTIFWKSNCRLAGINAPELNAKDPALRARALEAKQYLIDKLPSGMEIRVCSRELDKYGRPVVDIYYGDGFANHINQELLDKGLADKYV